MHDGKGLRVGVRLGLAFVLGGGPMLLYLRLLAWWAVAQDCILLAPRSARWAFPLL